MSDVTPHLGLPLIAAGQAQKHVTHNEALAVLDGLVQLSCIDKDLAAPPSSPNDGDRYLVAASAPTGAWAGLSGQVASFTDGVWLGLVPSTGWLAYIADEKLLYVFDGQTWVMVTSVIQASTDKLGVNTAPDSTNRFAVKSDAAFFAWDDATPGTGDMRITVNKKATGKDAGFVFQNGWSSRALFGTLGSDDFVLKTSANGQTFNLSLTAAAATGIVSFAASPLAPTPTSGDNSTRLATTAYVDRAVTVARTVVSDADYTVLATDRTVAANNLSAPRKLTLPRASAYPRSATLTVLDETGSWAPARSITVQAAQGDTISGLAAAVMAAPYGALSLQSDGASRWTVIGRTPFQNRSSFTDVALQGIQQKISNSFQRVNLQTIKSDTGGNWDATNNWYVCPRTGIYQISAALRADDSLSVVSQYGIGVHTSEVDGPHFLWAFTASGKATRSTTTYSRIVFQNAGDKLRMFTYSEPDLNIVGAGLQILEVSEALF